MSLRKRWLNGYLQDSNSYQAQYTQQNNLQVTIGEAVRIVEAMLYRNSDIESPDFDMFTLKQTNSLRKLLTVARRKSLTE